MSQPPEHTLTPVNQEALLPPEVAEAQVGEFLVTNQELFEEVHDRWS